MSGAESPRTENVQPGIRDVWMMRKHAMIFEHKRTSAATKQMSTHNKFGYVRWDAAFFPLEC